MKVSTPDIAKALLAELQAVREKHRQFQTRVKAADKAARDRDEKSREQNAALKTRIGELETELEQTKESIEALRQFTKLLPDVKNELDAFEDEVKIFEAFGSDDSDSDEAAEARARVHALERGVNEITKLCNLSEADSFDFGTESDFSLIEGSPDVAEPDAEPITTHPTNPVHAPKAKLSAEPRHQRSSARAYDDFGTWYQSDASLFDDPQTNRERLELVLKLMEQPLKLGELCFIIPTPWFDDWKKICQHYPGDIETEVGRINTCSMRDILDYTKIARMSIGAPVWYQLLEWYGSDKECIPSVVMPLSPGETPFVDLSPQFSKVYFMLPPSRSRSSIVFGPYTPLVIVPSKCSVRSLRSIIFNSLPKQHGSRSMDLYRSPMSFEDPKGWYISHRSGLESILPESQADKEIKILSFLSVIVSVKVFDETKGCMVPIDPFPSSASPSRYLTWSPSCE